MRSECKIDVVIPAYNAARTLPRALTSAQSQSLAPSHVIVVDDGSTDGSLSLRNHFPTVDWIAIRNAGPATARNVGWRKATSEWIAFLDADDRWLPKKLESVSELISSDPKLGVVFSDAVRVVNGAYKRRWSEDAPPQTGRVLAELLCGNFICQSTAVVRRDALLRVGGYDESFKAWEDVDLWLRLARHERFGYVKDVLVEYHMGSATLSGRLDAMAEGRCRSVASALSWPEVQALPGDVRDRAIAESLLQLAHTHYLRGRDTLARRTLRSLVRQVPRSILDPRLVRPYAQSFLPADLRTWLRVRRHASAAPSTAPGT